jgi:hypothetical protein
VDGCTSVVIANAKRGFALQHPIAVFAASLKKRSLTTKESKMKKLFATLAIVILLNGCCSNGRVMPDEEMEAQARHLDIHSVRN